MGIPTSAGAIVFDRRYLHNPLVFCGTIGIMPKRFVDKKVMPGDLIVAIGGRTGRDGIHGATFSSIGMDVRADSSCVQIGDPVTEKKFSDVLLKLRDMDLYNAVTDCGAGGFSSAIGELGKDTGARVRLEDVPLKYENLAPWEIFLSESQERMVLSVPPQNIEKLSEMLRAEDVETAALGEFTDTGRLQVHHKGECVADIDMDFLHNGIPKMSKKASWKKPKTVVSSQKSAGKIQELFFRVISHPNVASRETVIRQYDHEVQGGSVLKPLSGAGQDIPQDGSVTRPVLDTFRGIAVGLGINPYFSAIDPYHMAASVCEEAARNLVSCGGNLDKAAFMDNFSWGDVEDENNLGGLVRASKGCYDASILLGIPFVSGKDSLNNFYMIEDKKIDIPQTLLVTCVAPVEDARKSVGVGFKKADNLIYLVGNIYPELGGSVLYNILGLEGEVPKLRKISPATLRFVQDLIEKDLIISCHDLSDGGLAVGLAEMCFSGTGAEINISKTGAGDPMSGLFSESNSRFLVEAEEKDVAQIEKMAGEIPVFKIGRTLKEDVLRVKKGIRTVFESPIRDMKAAWKGVLQW
jgi:phosphoribosylformylglycinamidine synthase